MTHQLNFKPSKYFHFHLAKRLPGIAFVHCPPMHNECLSVGILFAAHAAALALAYAILRD